MYKEIENGAVAKAKSYMGKGSLIYKEMRKYLTIYEEVVSHILIWLCNFSILNFLMCEENLIFFFYRCNKYNSKLFYAFSLFVMPFFVYFVVATLSSHKQCFRRIFCMQFEYFWIVKILDLYGDDSTQFADWGGYTVYSCFASSLPRVCMQTLLAESRFANLETPSTTHSPSMHWKALYCLLYCLVRVDFALALKKGRRDGPERKYLGRRSHFFAVVCGVSTSCQQAQYLTNKYLSLSISSLCVAGTACVCIVQADGRERVETKKDDNKKTWAVSTV